MYSEEGQVIRGSRNIGALGADLFGDQVSLYTGELTFAQMDVSLPGNSALAVSVGRRFRPSTPATGSSGYGLFADWDLDIPHISGTFSDDKGWAAVPDGSTVTYQRCSSAGPPPEVTGDYNPLTPGLFEPDDYWHGTSVHLPGRGDDDLLDGPAPGAAAATYPKTTRHFWRIGCTSLANPAATPVYQTGEGYVVTTPDGVTYRFDWLVSRSAPTLVKPAGSSGGQAPPPGTQSPIVTNYLLNRIESWMLPTQVTDAFGNWVTYTYDASHPWRLTKITANDGRTITLHYDNTTTPDFVSSVTTTDGASGTHTWKYQYGGASGPLASVTLPDSSQWTFSLASLSSAQFSYAAVEPTSSCTVIGTLSNGGPFTGTITHPSGATGMFTVQATRHARSYVPKRCIGGPVTAGYVQYPWNPEQWDAYSLTTKTISGPGLGSLSWNYSYSTAAPSWSTDACATANNCSTTKTVSVVDPESHTTTCTFGTRFNVNEGLLQSTNVDSLRTEASTYSSSIGAPGLGQTQRGDGFIRSAPLPIDSRTTTQQGQTFAWAASAFSTYAHPTHIKRSSDLPYTRNETIAYESKTTPWLLDLMDSTTEDSTGAVIESHTYDASTGEALTNTRYGITQDTYAYNGDGTVYTHQDAGANTTTYTNYKLGIAQNVSLPDGNAESAVVDGLGRITSVTNAAGFTTSYGYDVMSRLSSVTPPNETALTYNATALSFTPVTSAEYGLAAGHWKQTITTGKGVAESYFDALWRPVVTRAVDTTGATTIAATQRYTVRRFDSQGRTTFAAYPVSSLTAYSDSLNGVATTYDALGRATGSTSDSELGSLSTSTQYLAGFQTKFTDARSNVTTTSYQAFDTPTTDAPTTITLPGSVTVGITRDTFGKPTAIQRSGTYSGATVSVTRSYVYDSNQRLCKTIEPERGATVQDYDSANNVKWIAAGTTLTSTTTCDRTSVGASQQTTFGYDAMNRLTGTSYGDSSPGVTETYTADGLPSTIASDGSTWTYTYNKHRLLTNESLAFNGSTNAIGYGIDANAHVKQVTYPDGVTVSYAPDALGEATQVGVYASALTYYPNGALDSFTYGNAATHSTTQNTRGLPSESTDTFGATKILDDVLGYDQNANPTSITDNAGTGNSRSMGYDALDRLTSASGAWGSGSYTYDPLDNMRTSTVGARSYTHTYDSNNRLSALKVNTTVAYSYAYDARGNLSTRNSQSFTFDQANRLRTVPGVASYKYDGLGRRTLIAPVSGGAKTQVYSQGGQLMYETSGGVADRIFCNEFESTSCVGGAGTRYVYLGHHLIASDGAAGLSYVHTDALGSPVAYTNASGAVTQRRSYEPYGAPATGNYSDGPGYTGHVMDAGTQLSYMQARYYDPIAARFLSVDPVAPKEKTGENFSRYWYANDDPFKNIDRDGRYVTCDQTSCTGEYHSYLEGAIDYIHVGIIYAYRAAQNAIRNESQAPSDSKSADEPKTSDRPAGSDGKRGSTGGPGSGKRFPQESPEAKAEKNGVPCRYCGQTTTNSPGLPNTRERDHIDPKSRGGNNSEENEGDSCRTCNRQKGAKNPDEWEPKNEQREPTKTP